MMVDCLKGLENTKIPNDDVGNGNYDDSDDDDDDDLFLWRMAVLVLAPPYMVCTYKEG